MPRFALRAPSTVPLQRALRATWMSVGPGVDGFLTLYVLGSGVHNQAHSADLPRAKVPTDVASTD